MYSAEGLEDVCCVFGEANGWDGAWVTRRDDRQMPRFGFRLLMRDNMIKEL